MRIKVDEDLPQAAAQMLRDTGYVAAGVVEQGLGDVRIRCAKT